MYDPKRCMTCAYSSKLNESQPCCLYILIEGRMRGCYDGDECTKYEKLTKRRRANLDMEGGKWFYVYD